jgi:hypothetical protein
MPDIDVLRELTGQLRAPGFDDLVAVSRRRRQRAAAAAATAVAVIVLAVAGALALAVPDTTGTPQPAPEPTPTPTVGGGDLRLERILARGTIMEEVSAPDGSLRAQYACTNCAAGVDFIHHHPAIQVTEGDSTALFGARGFVLLTVLDEHTVLAQDSAAEDAPVRYRLLRADGTEIALSMVADPAPAIPGPDVFVDRYARKYIDYACCYVPGTNGRDSLAVVDAEAQTVRPVAAPDDIWSWGPNTHEALWGVTDDCRVYWAVDGTYQESDAGCTRPRAFTYINPEWFPAGWLAPGRMAVAQMGPHGNVLLHVTLDGGETWKPYGGVLFDDRDVPSALRVMGRR